MSITNSCVEGCNLPSTPNDIKILLKQIKREITELATTTEAKLLCHDGKIAELCKYIKDNLSNTIRCLLDSMQLSGELDKIITDAILSDYDLLHKKVNDFVNVKEFGVVGDGVSDDTEHLQNAINCNKNTTLYIPKGKYRITKTIYVKNQNSIEMDNEAEIFADASMDYLIVYNEKDYTGSYERTFNKFIKGGILNGNYKVNEALLTLQGYLYIRVSNITFLNFNKYGLKSKIEDTHGNELVANHLYFRNDKAVVGTMAIKNVGHDAIFSDIIIRDIHRGIETLGATIFSKIHGWIGMKDLLPNSYFIKCLDYTNKISDCYSDTYQDSFINCFGTTFITNSIVLWNTDIYTQDMANNYPITVYKAEKDIYGFNSYGTFRTFGNTIQTKLKGISITNRSSMYNNFDDHISNYDNLSNINYFTNNDKIKSGTALPLDELFEPGAYGVNNNASIPDNFYQYGTVIVIPINKTPHSYLSNEKTDNLSYCTQIYITTESSPKVYIRNYINKQWGNWVEK